MDATGGNILYAAFHWRGNSRMLTEPYVNTRYISEEDYL